MSWPKDAYVGQKVICIDDSPTTTWGRRELKLNSIYTISRLEICKHPFKAFYIAVWLIGMGDRICPLSNIPIGFNINRFRPVQSTKTGMAILNEILITQKIKENT